MKSLFILTQTAFNETECNASLCQEKHHCEYFTEDSCEGDSETCPQVDAWLEELQEEIEARWKNRKQPVLADFTKGDRVLYIPRRKHHGPQETGVVSSVKNNYVFVKYDLPQQKMLTGDEDVTALATAPTLLKKLPKEEL